MRFPPAATPMSRTLPLLLLAATFALAGCDRDAAPATDGPDASAAPDATADARAEADDFERTWLGVLPCADCDGIQTRLQLQRDGDAQTYDLEETYLGADGEAVFTQAGQWVREDGDDGAFRLDPDSPASRRYALRPDGSLDQLDRRGEPLQPEGQYRLQRL